MVQILINLIIGLILALLSIAGVIVFWSVVVMALASFVVAYAPFLWTLAQIAGIFLITFAVVYHYRDRLLSGD